MHEWLCDVNIKLKNHMAHIYIYFLNNVSTFIYWCDTPVKS